MGYFNLVFPIFFYTSKDLDEASPYSTPTQEHPCGGKYKDVYLAEYLVTGEASDWKRRANDVVGTSVNLPEAMREVNMVKGSEQQEVGCPS